MPHLRSPMKQDNTKSILSHLAFLVINRKFVSNINENSLSGNHALQLMPSFTDMERIFLSWEKMGVYSHDRPLKPWQ